MKRFQPGRYVMFRQDGHRRVYFGGKFVVDSVTGAVAPRETFDATRALVFQSAAHAYCFGRELRGKRRRVLLGWQVGRV